MIPHPGKHLGSLLKLCGMTQRAACVEVGIHKTVLNEIINGKRSITPAIAVKLDVAALGTAEDWMGAQSAYDCAREREKLSRKQN